MGGMGDAVHLAMHPEMIAEYSIWSIMALVLAVAVLGAWLVEGVARRLVPLALRRAHNDVAAAMFATIGTTFAVLLAFVAMLSWESFAKAEGAAADEAAAIGSVALALHGLPPPDAAALRARLADYARTVVEAEWPTQAHGGMAAAGSPQIMAINAAAATLQPQTTAEAAAQARALAAITHLAESRAERLHLAAATMPDIIWLTLLAGGGLTIAAASFVAAPSLRVHLVMSSVLAVSGALVLVLIIALSNPFRGDFRVSETPYRAVMAQLAAE